MPLRGRVVTCTFEWHVKIHLKCVLLVPSLRVAGAGRPPRFGPNAPTWLTTTHHVTRGRTVCVAFTIADASALVHPSGTAVTPLFFCSSSDYTHAPCHGGVSYPTWAESFPGAVAIWDVVHFWNATLSLRELFSAVNANMYRVDPRIFLLQHIWPDLVSAAVMMEYERLRVQPRRSVVVAPAA